jgi:hypothetical protein
MSNIKRFNKLLKARRNKENCIETRYISKQKEKMILQEIESIDKKIKIFEKKLYILNI